MLPEGIKRKSLEEARQQGVSFGEFVRRALEQSLLRTNAGKQGFDRSDDPLFQGMRHLASQTQSRITDASANHDEYLYGKGA